MIIDLALIRTRRKALQVEREFRAEELELQSEVVRLEKPVLVRVEVQVLGERVRIKGRFQAEIELTCCRCLGTFRLSLTEDFRLEYRPDLEFASSQDEQLNYRDLGIGFYHRDRLDLSYAVGEQVLLRLPLNPVCLPTCKGLCDQCGQDFNQGQCDCVRQAPDPRLVVLAEFKKKLER